MHAALERLGEDAWDALTEAGHTAWTPGGDGFDLLGDKAKPDEAAIVLKLDGPLLGCGTAGVRRTYFSQWEQALTAAGFTTRRLEVEQVPVVLYATKPPSPGHPAGRPGYLTR